jgi:predicted XRE-type DNA-binding protein
MKLTFEEKKKRLENAGWKVGNAEDLLGLSPAESEYIDVKIALSRKLREIRQQRNLSQIETAKILKTSQSRIVKMEKGDASVSTDLLIKGLFSLGVKRKNLAKILS